jgi:hypothetical protein
MNTPSQRGNALIWTVIVIVVAVLAFYLGSNYGSNSTSVASITSTTTTSTITQEGSEYYSNPAEWQMYSDTSGGFSIEYPIDFNTDEPATVTSSTDWLENNVPQAPGFKAFTLTIPSAFDPQTNLIDATLTVGYSSNKSALADCLIAQNGEATSTPQTIDGTDFTVFTSSQGAAGSTYQTTSYRTMHGGSCYAVEYTIHSAQIANFPSSYNLQPFDQNQVTSVLDRIVGTFMFL